MGQKSIKENKNKYQICREKMGLTREAASEMIGFISASKIEKIESEKQVAAPDEVLALAKCYKDSSLCNYYCTHDCALGKEYVPEVKYKTLEKVTLEVLSCLTKLSTEKDRLIEITADGLITDDECDEFVKIHDHLTQMSMAIDTLQLWIDEKIGEGTYNGKFGEVKN